MRKLGVIAALLAGLGALVVSAALAGAGAPARATAHLSGYEEVPSVSTTGRGSFHAEIDRHDQRIHYRLRYSRLEGTTTEAAHIHLGQPAVNGGVIAFLCGGGDKPACPPGSGTVTGVIDAQDIVGPAAQGIAPGEFEEVVRAVRAGVTYANVHTNKHPGGEIRGQIER